MLGLRPSSTTSYMTLIGHLLSHCLNFLDRKIRMTENSGNQHPFPHGVITVRIELTLVKRSGQFLAYGHN